MTSWNGNKTGVVLRPIIRERFTDDLDAAAAFAINQSSKLSIGGAQYRQRFGSASAGSVLRSFPGGGVYDPPVVPRNPGNLGTS